MAVQSESYSNMVKSLLENTRLRFLEDPIIHYFQLYASRQPSQLTKIVNGLTKHEKHRVYRIINHIKLNAFQIQSYPEVLDEYLNRFSIKDNNKRDLALKLFDHLTHHIPPSRIVGICYFLTAPQRFLKKTSLIYFISTFRASRFERFSKKFINYWQGGHNSTMRIRSYSPHVNHHQYPLPSN